MEARDARAKAMIATFHKSVQGQDVLAYVVAKLAYSDMYFDVMPTSDDFYEIGCRQDRADTLIEAIGAALQHRILP